MKAACNEALFTVEKISHRAGIELVRLVGQRLTN